MSVEPWITLAVAVVCVPSVAWLVKEVLNLRGKMIELETRLQEKDKNCQRHQQWQSELQSSLTKIEKNISRLCQKSGVQESD